MVWAVDLDDMQYTSASELARALGMSAVAKAMNMSTRKGHTPVDGVE